MSKIRLRTLIILIILLGIILTLSGCVGDETVFGGNTVISTLL